ncbi:uncharacterized protein MELLADRAFT_112237 [Melampsora larici-populina 98AG31]|uniref:Uncharacterized protein n=1 Tax=Melampsora larici-populina (strain 98AG31 / pathotype 3-4-7) TaxID=747676 RepID=F4S5T8_MELLP|nr:uncharacterized protein MELLADRAFT_112237 [Melampsora larici-populina 98AG31]EGG00007.1 hypothetical protein MELLADRAFT_112237 [Melampsora larici-populina 98AG31]
MNALFEKSCNKTGDNTPAICSEQNPLYQIGTAPHIQFDKQKKMIVQPKFKIHSEKDAKVYPNTLIKVASRNCKAAAASAMHLIETKMFNKGNINDLVKCLFGKSLNDFKGMCHDICKEYEPGMHQNYMVLSSNMAPHLRWIGQVGCEKVFLVDYSTWQAFVDLLAKTTTHKGLVTTCTKNAKEKAKKAAQTTASQQFIASASIATVAEAQAPVRCPLLIPGVPWVRCVAKRCGAELVAHIGAQALHTVTLHCAARTNAAPTRPQSPSTEETDANPPIPATPRQSSRPPVVRRDTNMCAPSPDSRRALPTRNPICTPKSNTTSVVSSPSTVRASKTNKRKGLGQEAEKGQQEPSSDATISKEMEVNLAQDSDNEPLHGKEDVITGTLPTINEECEDKVAIVIDDTESVNSEILTSAPSNAVEDHDKEEIPEEAAEIEYDEDAEDALDLEDAKLDRLEDEELAAIENEGDAYSAADRAAELTTKHKNKHRILTLMTNVIDALLKADLDKVKGSGSRRRASGKPCRYFHEICFSPSDWDTIEEVNSELKLEAEKLQAQSIDISTSEPDSTGLDSAPSDVWNGYSQHPSLNVQISYNDEEVLCISQGNKSQKLSQDVILQNVAQLVAKLP